jgi:Hsp20/alpha crystallin family
MEKDRCKSLDLIDHLPLYIVPIIGKPAPGLFRRALHRHARSVPQRELLFGGKKQDKGDVEYLYQGISARSFERRFNLADYIEVENAAFENGLLHINLVRRIPDKMKPRKIDIGNVTQLETRGSGKAA